MPTFVPCHAVSVTEGEGDKYILWSVATCMDTHKITAMKQDIQVVEAVAALYC
jgi:hypothetical protein